MSSGALICIIMKACSVHSQPLITGAVLIPAFLYLEISAGLASGAVAYAMMACGMLWFAGKTSHLLLSGVLLSLFLVVIFYLAWIHGHTDMTAMASGILSLALTWLTVFFALRYRNLYRENKALIEANLVTTRDHSKALDAMVKQRTAELEAMNQKLVKSQMLYRSMARNFPDGIIGVMDQDMKYLLVDGKGLAALGLDAATVIGDRIFDSIHQAMTTYAEGALKKVFHGETISFDLEIEGKYYNVSSTPINHSAGPIKEILVVIKNVSSQKQLERELVRTLAREKELNSLKSRFVTMASHEFRTPLTTILSSAFLLENYTGDRLESEKKKHIDRIKRSVHGLTDLLNDFLSLGKLEEGMVEVSYKPIKLRDFVAELLQEVSLVKKEGQQIVMEFRGDQDEILMDRQLLRNILLNLLSNAIKYSPVASTIGLEVTTVPHKLKLSVRDEGIGIPVAEQRYIFKRFFRANNTSDIQGTGLGLNIVKRYVKLLKGNIYFNSVLNKGTTFTVTLPFANASEHQQIT